MIPILSSQKSSKPLRMRFRNEILAALLSITTTIITAEITLRFVENKSDLFHGLLWFNIELVSTPDLPDKLEKLLTLSPTPPKPYSCAAGFRTDEHGFRTTQYDYTKPENTFRIVALGDSFTFSSGRIPFEQMWFNHVAQELENSSQKDIQVINLGIPGVGPVFEKHLFELEGKHLQPNLVLLGLFIGNDFRPRAPMLVRLSRPLKRYSYSWRIATSLWGNRKKLSALFANNNDRNHPSSGECTYHYNPDAPTFSEQVFLEIEHTRSWYFAKTSTPYMQKEIQRVITLLYEMNDTMQEIGSNLVVILIPDQLQVEKELQKSVLNKFGNNIDEYDFRALNRQMTQELSKRSIHVVDLLPAFLEKTNDDSLYLPRDTHWNVEGNLLAGQEILSYLSGTSLLPFSN